MTYKDINILHEDNHILVVEKPQNMPTQGDSSKDLDLLTLLKQYLKETYNKSGEAYLGLVHRLDRPTGGVMVFAKTSKAASRLCNAIKEGNFYKKYFAVVIKPPVQKTARLTHWLKKDTSTNTVTIAPATNQDAKKAELEYTVVEEHENLALVRIKLLTGRSHQARVQMSYIGCPIYGDFRYGGATVQQSKLALWAYELRFTHPVTNTSMVFKVFPPEDQTPWKLFALERHMRDF